MKRGGRWEGGANDAQMRWVMLSRSMHKLCMPDYGSRPVVVLGKWGCTNHTWSCHVNVTSMHIEHDPYGIQSMHGHYQQPQLKSWAGCETRKWANKIERTWAVNATTTTAFPHLNRCQLCNTLWPSEDKVRTEWWLSDDSPEESTQEVPLVGGWRPGCNGWLLHTHHNTSTFFCTKFKALLHQLYRIVHMTTRQCCSSYINALVHQLYCSVHMQANDDTSKLQCPLTVQLQGRLTWWMWRVADRALPQKMQTESLQTATEMYWSMYQICANETSVYRIVR